MRSTKRGKRTLPVEILNISRQGIWILANDVEHFCPFELHPWVKNATVAQIHNVELSGTQHLHWPELDVDIEVESLVHPERYPLASRVTRNKV